MKNGDKFAVMGTRGEFHVFATVIDILKAFVRIRTDEPITFTAKEPSRQRLYDTILRRIQIAGWRTRRLSASEFIIAPDFKSRPRVVFPV